MSDIGNGNPQSAGPGDRFRVAGWIVDVRALEITSRGETRKIESKAMELLVCLARRPGEVVSREELERSLWPDVVVGYDSLSAAVIKLRKAFGDSARNPTIVGTVPKVGYRLLAEVAPEPPREPGDAAGDSTSAPSIARQARWMKPPAMALAAVLLAAGGFLWWQQPEPDVAPARTERMAYALPDKPSIAVLPFDDLSPDEHRGYFVDGMTEDLITDLSKSKGLFVVAANSIFLYKDKAVLVREVAEELGVRYVLRGSVRRAGRQVRINARLVDALTGRHVWAERYDGVVDDVFALQDQVAGNIVAELAINLDPQGAGAETAHAGAYDLFLRGWQQYRRGTASAYAEAIPYFEQALDRDPDYARARAALAAVYWNSLWKGWWSESLGLAYYQAAERFRLLLRRSLQQPTALTHQVASEWSAFFKRSPDEALAEADLALALDPNDPAGHLAKANALLKDGRANEAEEKVRTAMRLDPHHPPAYLVRLAQAQFQQENYRGAANTLEKVVAQKPANDWAFTYLAAAYGQLGLSGKAGNALTTANTLRAEAGWGPVTEVAASHPRFRWPGDRGGLREGLRRAGAEGGGEWLERMNYGRVAPITPPTVNGVPTIDARRAKGLHEGGAVFVATNRGWYDERIPGSHFMEFWGEGWLFNEAALSRVAGKQTEIVVYSNQPVQAGYASALAASRGFENVYYFPGGVDDWQAAGYPVDAGD